MTPPARSGPSRPMLVAGFVLFWALQATLLLVVGMPVLDSVVVSVLLVVVPVFSIAQLPMIEDGLVDRLPAYWASIATLWLLGTGCWLVGAREGGAAALGLVAMRPGAFWTWTSVLVAAALGVILAFRRVATWSGTPDSPLLRQLLPRTGREKRVFALLSLAAGLGEEIAYRGYAIPVLAPVIGTAGAAILSSAVFGVVHVYQGALGILRTGLMGGVLAWGFLASGSLWPAVAAHVVIDLVAGIVLGERLLSPVAPEGVRPVDLQESEG